MSLSIVGLMFDDLFRACDLDVLMGTSAKDVNVKLLLKFIESGCLGGNFGIP